MSFMLRYLSLMLACLLSVEAASPEFWQAKFGTTVSSAPITINVTRSLAPIGADRFFQLVNAGYYDDNGFVRLERSSLLNFVLQWGIASDPAVSTQWSDTIKDDPVAASNLKGTVALAADASKPASRSTMIYINLADNSFLDKEGYAPFGVVADQASWETIQQIMASDRYDEVIYLPMAFGMGSAWIRANYPGLPFTTTAIAVVDGTTLPAASEARHAATAVSQMSQAQALPQLGATLTVTHVAWLGNTWGGGPDQFHPTNASWISYTATDVAVRASDGLTVTNSVWDEGTREAGIYNGSSGALLGLCQDLHGWSRTGGLAVAVTSSKATTAPRFYVAMTQSPLSYEGPLRDYPVNGTVWQAVRAYTGPGGVPVPFPGVGHGWDSSMIVVCSNCSALTGLAVSDDGGLLYVSVPDLNQVFVYNTTNMTLVAALPTPGNAKPGKLAVDPGTGGVWAAAWLDVGTAVWPYAGLLPPAPWTALWRYNPDGSLQPGAVVNDVALPADVAVHGPSRSLIVADNGPAQQLAVYSLDTLAALAARANHTSSRCGRGRPVSTVSTAVARTGTLGAAGGVLSPENFSNGAGKGVVRPDAFAFLVGVGVTDDGMLVVASTGYTTNKDGSGLDLRGLTVQPPLSDLASRHRTHFQGYGDTCDDTTSEELERALQTPPTAALVPVWNNLGLEWVDSGAVDPGSGSPAGVDVIYTEHERFICNYTAAARGEGQGSAWVYAGYTVDPLRFASSDVRLHGTSFDSASVTVRRFDRPWPGPGPNTTTHLFARGMYAQGPAWYRFEREQPQKGAPGSELAVPCGLFSKDAQKNGTWPPLAPIGAQSWAWQDVNGDGLMQAAEFVAFPVWMAGVWGTYIDSHGSLWVSSEDHWILAWAGTVNATTGCWQYNFTRPIANVSGDLPPFYRTERVVYLPETDNLLVSGFTPAENNTHNDWGLAGRYVVSYPGFLAMQHHSPPTYPPPGVAFSLPWSNSSCTGVCATDKPKSLDVADELLAVVLGESAVISVFNITNGAFVGNMSVAMGGSAMGNYTGWIG